MDPADFYGVRGAGFTSLRRELGWLPGDPHPREEPLTRAISAALLHLDDPDRLRATAAALAAPTPPDPGQLGERERRQWLMLTAQLFGTGKRWRPLADARALLWQASAWRDELRQLLHLLAERSGRRLHPLPWALRVHGRYSRAEIEAAFGILTGDAPWIHREAKACSGTNPASAICCSSPSTRAKPSSHPPPATASWPSALGCSTGRARAPPPPPPPPGRGCHRAVSLSGVCALREPRGGAADGDSLAVGAANSGGVDAGDGVGGLREVLSIPHRQRENLPC
jgi:hypothetical protein